MTWRDLETIRRLWPRHLVVKGIMHPNDAIRAAEAGVDGLIISNHGGRQLDQAPAPLEVLPLFMPPSAIKWFSCSIAGSGAVPIFWWRGRWGPASFSSDAPRYWRRGGGPARGTEGD